MRRSLTLLFTTLFLIVPSFTIIRPVSTQNCYVQIESISLNPTNCLIGETLYINVTYSLYYDPLDPLGIGALSVAIKAVGNAEPIFTQEFSDLGSSITETISLVIQQQDWEPLENEREGLVQIDAWVQDSQGSMTDYLEQSFWIRQSDIRFHLDPVINMVRGQETNLTLQVTTWENIPLSNLTISLINTYTNHTWATDNTNSSGYAFLTWFITPQIELGEHQFHLLAKDSHNSLGMIRIIIVIFSATVLSIEN